MARSTAKHSIYISRNSVPWLFAGVAAGVLLLLCCLGVLTLSNTTYLSIAMGTVGVCMVYCIRELPSRFLLFVFNATYFLFLLSGLAMKLFDQEAIVSYLASGEEAASHACLCIALSILVIDLTAFVLFEHHRDQLRSNWSAPMENCPNVTRQIILVLLLLSMACKLGTSLLRYANTLVSGYSSIYQAKVELPELLRIPASVFYMLLSLWLVTRPGKWQFLACFSIILLIEGLVFFSGDRGESTSALLFLLFYIYRRGKEDRSFFRITKLHVAAALLLLPLLIYLMQYVSFTRRHNTVVIESLVADFFESQGISAQIMSKGYLLKDEIAAIGGHSYATGSLRSYVLHNALTRALFGTDRVIANTEAIALSGESYGSTMAYLRFRVSYLRGVGCGTSFIAELWHDGGFPLLIIGSGLVAFLIDLVSRKTAENSSLFISAVFTMMILYIIRLPRDNCFAWLTETLSVNNLVLLALLLLVSSAARRRKGSS